MLASALGSALKMLKFNIKVFKTLYFLNPQMDLLYIKYDYRCWSKILFSTIHSPAYDLEVKVMDLEIYINKNVKVIGQSFKTLYFLNPQMDLFFIYTPGMRSMPKGYIVFVCSVSLSVRPSVRM